MTIMSTLGDWEVSGSLPGHAPLLILASSHLATRTRQQGNRGNSDVDPDATEQPCKML